MKGINWATGLLILMFSCRNKTNPPDRLAFSDSVVQAHLKEVDSLPGSDTTEVNYRLLKAYLANDSNYLRRFQVTQERERQWRLGWDAMDSGIDHADLQDLHADEAYRFNYRMPFVLINWT
jgi:hypothetical protein